MIRVFLYDPATKDSKIGGAELIESWQKAEQSILWLDIEGGSNSDDEKLLA